MLMFIAGVDFLVALGLAAPVSPARRRMLLGLSITSNLVVLGFFKYFNFFAANLHQLLDLLGLHTDPVILRVVLPVGISFYTFQALSYTIDVYRGKMHVVHNYVDYHCFITFFPHMFSGPIQQATHFLVQFEQDRFFDLNRATDGLRQMLWGFFKKMVVSDNLGPLVAGAYSHADTASGWELLWATYYFAIQIYCDFSGYTDIAIGCARLFGLNLTRNFAYPYFAENIREFWRRWHIALTTWFREYLYFPLGGNRCGRARGMLNIFIVFVVSGLWHGANWTFVVWGSLFGFYYIAHSFWLGQRQDGGKEVVAGSDRLGRLMRILLTFHAVLLAWVFFRAESVQQACLILERIGGALVSEPMVRPSIKMVILIALVLVPEWLQRHQEHALAIGGWPTGARWAAYYGLVGGILLGCHVGETPFIYFQF